MKSGLAEKVLDSILPKPSPTSTVGRASPGSFDDRSKLSHTGTTIVAFKYADGVMFAADRKIVRGYLSIFSLDDIKIEQVAPHTMIGYAGLVADAQFVQSILEKINSSFNSKYEFPLSVEGQANYVVTLCRNFRFYSNPWSWGLEIGAIIGGLDILGDFEIFEISGEGSLYKKDFTVIGSGADYALGVLKDNRKSLIERKLSLDESVVVAVKSVFRAGEADNGTSDVRVATPNVAVITKRGCEFIETEVVKKAVDRVLEKEL